jgi:hypothetical protein
MSSSLFGCRRGRLLRDLSGHLRITELNGFLDLHDKLIVVVVFDVVAVDVANKAGLCMSDRTPTTVAAGVITTCVCTFAGFSHFLGGASDSN